MKCCVLIADPKGHQQTVCAREAEVDLKGVVSTASIEYNQPGLSRFRACLQLASICAKALSFACLCPNRKMRLQYVLSFSNFRFLQRASHSTANTSLLTCEARAFVCFCPGGS